MSLEEAWGQEQYRLNLGTHRNILFLTSDLHILWDDNKRILLPDLEYIDKLYSIYFDDPSSVETIKVDVAKKADYADEDSFKYYMIPLADMKLIPIYRLLDDTAPEKSHLPSSRLLQYPYEGLGPLESHVYPHFAIVNAAIKLISISDKPLVTKAVR